MYFKLTHHITREPAMGFQSFQSPLISILLGQPYERTSPVAEILTLLGAVAA